MLRKTIKTILFALLLTGGIMEINLNARPMSAADKFYTADENALSAYLEDAFSKAGKKDIPGIVAVVSPHAGYMFSGRLAAQAFAPVNQSYDIVVIMGTGHTHAVKGAAILAEDNYETPFGVVETDKELAKKLIRKEPLFENYPSAHQHEHSIEVQLPFLQKKLKKPFKLLAMTLNYAGEAEVSKMAAALAEELKGRKALLVISTDLSHYTDTENAKYSDEAFAESVKTMDFSYIKQAENALLSKKIQNLQTVACGITALGLGMETAKIMGAKSFKIGEVSDSHREHEASKSPGRVVGYMSGWFIKSGQPPSEKLSNKQKKFLLKEARRSIHDALFSKNTGGIIKDPRLNIPGAVFVTLNINKQLRGCIGTLVPQMPLSDAVRNFALYAAFKDGRFPSLKAEELDKVRIEISVLSRLEKTAAENIIPRKHGVVVQRNGKSGVFLPQVWEQIPDKDSFMGELCQQKAGLSRDCWKLPGTEIQTFTVESFEEGERDLKDTSMEQPKAEKKDKGGMKDANPKKNDSGKKENAKTEIPKMKSTSSKNKKKK